MDILKDIDFKASMGVRLGLSITNLSTLPMEIAFPIEILIDSVDCTVGKWLLPSSWVHDNCHDFDYQAQDKITDMITRILIFTQLDHQTKLKIMPWMPWRFVGEVMFLRTQDETYLFMTPNFSEAQLVNELYGLGPFASLLVLIAKVLQEYYLHVLNK